MDLQSTPRGNRLHIGFYGRRNAGKSSLINLVTGQQTALVADHAGTTTDPVIKSMELLPLGPVAVIDTAGLDDEGDLGRLRISRTMEMMDLPISRARSSVWQGKATKRAWQCGGLSPIASTSFAKA